jgi:hypothetical protein
LGWDSKQSGAASLLMLAVELQSARTCLGWRPSRQSAGLRGAIAEEGASALRLINQPISLRNRP